jgi:ankyrin repeat protein
VVGVGPVLAARSFPACLEKSTISSKVNGLIRERLLLGFLLSFRDRSSNTVLIFACINGQMEAAKWLIGKGADVNVRECSHESNGSRRLMHDRVVSAPCINTLCEQAQNCRKETALMYACSWMGNVDLGE